MAATAIKTVWEEYFPVRDEDAKTPPTVLAEEITGKELNDKEAEQTSLAIHGVFGVGTGAVYGGLAEVVPEVTIAAGLPFGVSFYALTHGSTVPAAGLEPWPTEVKPEYARNEFVGHLVYALTLEVVRNGLRRYVVE